MIEKKRHNERQTNIYSVLVVGWKPIVLTFWPKNQSFRNKSGKTHPIRTKFGIRRHVKGWQRSRNFGRDRPILGKIGAGTSPAERELFCVVGLNHATFRQLHNGRFSPNLATKCNSVSRRWIRKNIFENFHFRSHLLQNLKSKIGRTGTSLRAGYSCHGMHCREILQYSTLLSKGRGSFGTSEVRSTFL